MFFPFGVFGSNFLGQKEKGKNKTIILVTGMIWQKQKPEMVEEFLVQTGWWLQPTTHLKNMLVKMGSSSPNSGKNYKKNIWNHHPPPSKNWLGFGSFSFFSWVFFFCQLSVPHVCGLPACWWDHHKVAARFLVDLQVDRPCGASFTSFTCQFNPKSLPPFWGIENQSIF